MANFNFKSYLKYLPLALIFFGLFYELIYYRLFGLNIIPYLSLAEALTAFMQISVALLLFVILVAFLFDIIQSSRIWGRIILIAVYFGAGAAFIIFNDKYIYYIYHLFGSVIIMASAWYVFFLLKVNDDPERTDKALLSRIFLFTLIFVISLSLNRFYKTSRHYTYGTEIETMYQTIRSDSSLVYIGDVANYVFLYNMQTNSNLVIPRSEILELRLHYNKNFPGHFANIYFDPQRQLNEVKRIVAE